MDKIEKLSMELRQALKPFVGQNVDEHTLEKMQMAARSALLEVLPGFGDMRCQGHPDGAPWEVSAHGQQFTVDFCQSCWENFLDLL